MFEFSPSVVAATRYDAAMHDALADSVISVTAQASTLFSSDTLAQISNWSAGIAAGDRYAAETFGAYFDLIDALQTDQFESATRLVDEIARTPVCSSLLQIQHLGRDYAPSVRSRFCRYMGNGKTDASGIAPAGSDDCTRFEGTLRSAIGLLSSDHPALKAEIEALIRAIVLVGPDGSDSSEFEGGTCFKLWGALFLNATCHTTPLDLAVTLAHEAGHAYLFGACRDEMLVENPDRERYWSAIRQSKRPLEGVFHATFVSARMIEALLHLRQSNGLSSDERRHLAEEIGRVSDIYVDGEKLLRRHARFTRTGHEVFREMTQAMDSLLLSVN